MFFLLVTGVEKINMKDFPMFFLVFSEQNICKKLTNGAKIQKKSYIFAAVSVSWDRMKSDIGYIW